MHVRLAMAAVLVLAVGVVASPTAGAATRATNVRLTNDDPALSGYVSVYTLGTGQAYTDDVLGECSISRGRQNEPAVEADPRNPDIIIGSSNDYCGVYTPSLAATLGPVWLGYYRSQDAGATFTSSLVPGYPHDTSPFAPLAHIRTFDAGDPVIAWDAEGRVFMGSESSGDPEFFNKENGDVWVARFANPDGASGDPANDGLLYQGTETIAKGSAAFNGKFNDKTAIEADRTQSVCRGNVYFSWARFTGDGSNGFNSSVYFSRSTDHGATWSGPKNLSQTIHDIQFPDIAVTSNGDVYVTFREFADVRSHTSTDSIWYVKSTDCGATFGDPVKILDFEPYDAADISAPEAIPTPQGPRAPEAPQAPKSPSKAVLAGRCGDFSLHCQSGYTFFRETTQVRSSADQTDLQHQYVYVVYDPSKQGTEVPTGTSYGSVVSGDLPAKFHQDVGSQQAVYFIRLDGATGQTTEPALIDDQATGHQRFPDIAVDGGSLHAIWWDSRLDPNYSPTRPIGNAADGTVGPALDVWAATSTDFGNTWTGQHRVTDVTSNPNYEQFSDRTVPFGGDYLWVTSVGDLSFTVWTDWRDTVQGEDPREITEDEDNGTADVHQCRTFSGTWSSDQCPHEGGIDQNIYGSSAS